MRLIGAGDVAGEEDHARRLNAGEQGSETWRYLGAVEADDEELADVHASDQESELPGLEGGTLRTTDLNHCAIAKINRANATWRAIEPATVTECCTLID